MDPTSHFKTRLNDLHTTMKPRALVSDLHLQVHFLDRDIHDEEQRTGILDLANIAYPILARTLRARRDNLLATIRMLENRMTETDAAALRKIMSRARRKAGRRSDEEIRPLSLGQKARLLSTGLGHQR
jgi:hypothetical protein